MTTHEARPGAEVSVSDPAGLPEHFTNPGLPEHQHRLTDEDPAAADRAERQVAAMFGLSALGTLLVLGTYFFFRINPDAPYPEFAGRVQLFNLLIGLGMAVALLGIGLGAVHWAKTLMPDAEWIEERHQQRSSDEERAAAVAILKDGSRESALGRRPLIRNSLIGALALLPTSAVALLGGLGPMPRDKLATAPWKKGIYLVRDPEGGRIQADGVVLGSVVHVMPEGIAKMKHPMEERAKAAVLVMRLRPEELDDVSSPGSYHGIVAYSKICTHVGCPVALYEHTTNHLLCPCHQSTFDVPNHCKVLFGPAKRPLPQLAVTVDEDGYLVAKDGFKEPVGPSYWSRERERP